MKNLALIQEAEVFFGPGLNILTGETGAGKSIILGSVGLALGGRADRDMIRTGADQALVELVFALDKKEQADKVRALDIPVEEDGMVILQRRILPGRSLSRVNGETVNGKLLKELSGILIDIHGQHDSQKLLKPKRHLEILDDFAGEEAADLKRELKDRYDSLRQTRKLLSECGMDSRERERALSLAGFEAKEIAEAGLKEGEDEELETRFRRMANSRRIAEAVGMSWELTGSQTQGGASEAVGRALRELSSVSAYDDGLEQFVSLLSDVEGLLNEFNRSASEYLSDLEFDQADFEQVEDRLNLINRLKQKYGNTIPDILRYQEEREREIERLQDADAYRERLQEKLKEEKKQVEALCGRLSGIREKAGQRLSGLLIEALQDLNFNQVDFDVLLNRKAEPASDGWDEAAFRISTNPGEPKKPLSEVASGGELSRIMLALKTVTAAQEDKDTFIFDEIDTGISGKTAWKVSQKLGILAKTRQVICITHLPQIAAMADHHFVIEKRSEDGSTATFISELREEAVDRELARMLGGEGLTESALANARELKEMAENTKQY